MTGQHPMPTRVPFETLRQTGMQHFVQHIPPTFKPHQLAESHNLLDMLASRLMPAKIFFDGAAVLTVAHEIIPASNKRTALHFVGPNSGRVTVSNEPGVTIDNGLTFSATAGILSIDSKIAGDLVTREIYAIAAGIAGSPTPFNADAFQASTAAAADLVSFTVPAGSTATLTGASVTNFVGGAPTIQLQLVRGASTLVLLSVTVATQWNTAINLVAGDIIKWRCTTGVAASTVDVTLSGTQTVTLVAPTPVSWIECYAPDNI